MEQPADYEIYKGKTFSSLCKDIVNNQNLKRDQLDFTINECRKLVKDVNDIVVVMPIIRDCFDVAVKNDEQLIKLASVIQKIITRANSETDGNGGFSLTDEERKQLSEEVAVIAKTNDEIKIPAVEAKDK